MSHPIWPLFDLQARTPKLTLRYIDDDLSVRLAELAARGIHDPSWMPFAVPWTDFESPDLERRAMQFHWRCRADTSPAGWRIPLAVLVDGEVVGASDLAAAHFPQLRQFETGSWLGREYQGRGLGKELRLATLTLGFDGLGADLATTGAYDDNRPSLGVTRSLGYQPNGQRRQLRRGRPDEIIEFRMTREHFDTIRRDDIAVMGTEPVRELLGISPAA